MTKIQVRKRDGTLENFEMEKLEKSIRAADAGSETAHSIASEIEKWLPKVATNNIVQSSTLRGKILQLLRPQNPKAALSFEQYKE